MPRILGAASAAASALIVLLVLVMLVAPARANPALAAAFPYGPPPGMTLTSHAPVNMLQLQADPGIPSVYLRQVVPYQTQERPGTIVVDTRHRFLYLVMPEGRAMRYGIGVARSGFEWRGTHTVTAKREWPGWTPPAAMRQRQPELPAFMAGGPNNPLGARALYLGSTLYRIHGTNEPWTIGHNVSSGCIRMTNQDVIDLYDRVPVGARVVVLS